MHRESLFGVTADQTSEQSTTPVRGLGTPDPAGFHLLRDVGSSYRDGAEAAVLRIVSDATDVRSDSDELVRAASGWAQRYHLDPARANVIRSVDLPADARVLEIGAGCGAITRYLGEQCAVVDALEPVPARAAVASARCRDLPGVAVLVGELDDVPAQASYDVIVVVGVLEYVGNGTANLRPYQDFLDAVAARLVDGGVLILAIENKLGVKYLVGSPEDHTDRVWDGLEGYPRGGQARTFSRRELEQLMQRSGLTSSTRIAFPDYKMTRAVLGDGFPDDARSLLHRVPDFPSPDWRTPRPRIGDERAVWRQLVDAGLELEFGNSLLVLAAKNGRASNWPDERLGVFFSAGRRHELEMRTDVESIDGRVQFRRAPRSADAGPSPSGVCVLPSTAAFEPGTDVTEYIARGGPDAFGEFADAWLELVDRAVADDPGAAIDLVPHNLVVDGDGRLRPIDLEFTGYPVTREQVVRRGVYHLANRAAPLAAPERWAPDRTVGDLMVRLGTYVGLPNDGSWLEPMMADELEFYAAVRAIPSGPDGPQRWRAGNVAWLRGNVERTLASLPLGDRAWQQATRAEAALSKQRRRVQELEAALTKARAVAAKSERARRRLAAAPEVRVARRLRRAVAQALPRGTTRGGLARRVVSRSRGR
ncbi:methyltransferase domain-containing protein [uncultured Jatrophihabitans sp.]|uniref:methyltransferase domain-containing protein n=1 Tax=uncultured Jatrophihabitans sp. TaxID=1610747 RepID=UPI0035CC1895